jgi:Spy/CpxP family protein refolding chaperone
MNNARSIKITIYSLLIFVGGFVSGLLLAPMIGRSFLSPPHPGDLSRHMLSRLQSSLQLTPEQTEQIKPLMDETTADMETIRSETTKRVTDRISETNAKIRLLLTPEQKKRFEEMEAQRRAHMRGGPGRPSSLPPPPGL